MCVGRGRENEWGKKKRKRVRERVIEGGTERYRKKETDRRIERYR